MLTIGVLERNWAAVRTTAQLRAAVTGSGATERRWMAAPGRAHADLAAMFDEASTLHVYTWKPLDIYSLTVIENVDYETLTNVSDCQLYNI